MPKTMPQNAVALDNIDLLIDMEVSPMTDIQTILDLIKDNPDKQEIETVMLYVRATQSIKRL